MLAFLLLPRRAVRRALGLQGDVTAEDQFLADEARIEAAVEKAADENFTDGPHV